MNGMFRFTKNELQRRAMQRDILQELVFNADTNETCDIEVVTLRQHLRDRAMSRAWETDPDDITNLNENVERLLRTKYTTSAEFVEVQKNKIKIGIDATTVTDDIIDKALLLLIQVDDITKQQIVTFGEAIQVYEPID